MTQSEACVLIRHYAKILLEHNLATIDASAIIQRLVELDAKRDDHIKTATEEP